MRSRLGALRPHRGETFAIARERHVLGIEVDDELAGKLGGILPLAQAEEGPRALAKALDQPRLGEKPQMARNARLRLAQDGGEIRNGQLGLGQQREDAQPRGLGRGLERLIDGVEGQVGTSGHEARARSHFG
jgi:hypothetical protein